MGFWNADCLSCFAGGFERSRESKEDFRLSCTESVDGFFEGVSW